eukprot:507742-Pelagomonas_calceolata.AAC.2
MPSHADLVTFRHCLYIQVHAAVVDTIAARTTLCVQSITLMQLCSLQHSLGAKQNHNAPMQLHC